MDGHERKDMIEYWGVFLDRHERKDVIEYWGVFLEKMKVLLPYFIKFKKNGTILPKKYLKDYVVRGSDGQLIIMIIYDKSIFSTNNSYQKFERLKDMEFFGLK